MQLKLYNYAKEDLLQDFKPDHSLINLIIYDTATVINSLIPNYKEYSLKQREWK